MKKRILLRAATILGEDARGLCLTRADVLIAGDKIEAVGAKLDVEDCEHVDCEGSIVLPGMVDTHRHVWQTPLRGLGADWTVLDYLAGVRMKLSAAFDPDDLFIANEVGALEALDSGITTIVDFCHCINSPEHADAALDGLERAGIRAEFCYGFAANPADPSAVFARHEERIAHARAFFKARARGSDALVNLGFSLTEMQVPWEWTEAELRCARDLGGLTTLHCASWPVPGETEIERLRRGGWLRPELLFVHCTHASDHDLRTLAEAGASLSATPETELQMGMGMPAIVRAARAGLRTSLGCDVVTSNNGDPFAMMRLALQVSRGLVNAEVGLPMQIGLASEQVLAMMTLDAARALGRERYIGSITPGKQADLVIVRSDAPNLLPTPSTPGALVTQAHAGNVEAVLVAGTFRKRSGKLVGVDMERLRNSLAAVRDRLLQRCGGEAELLSERANLLRHWNMGQDEIGTSPVKTD